MKNVSIQWPLESRACRSKAISIPSRNRRQAFNKDKYLKLMFDDVGQARTNAAILLLMIAPTSSRTLHKTHDTVVLAGHTLIVLLLIVPLFENLLWQLVSVKYVNELFATAALKLLSAILFFVEI